jgi:hypothetical protein
MSFLHKIKSGACWLHQNQSTIEAKMELNFLYGKAALRDACKIAKVIDQPLKVPKIEQMWKHIQPLLPSKGEVIENAFSNCIKCEEKYRLISQALSFFATRSDKEITSLIFHDENYLSFSFVVNSKSFTGYITNEYIYIYPPENNNDDDYTFYEIESFALWYMHEHDNAVCEDDEELVAS